MRYYFKNKNKGFTIVEILMVIIIIGIVSSIVLVSLNGIKERERIKIGLSFSKTIQNVLGVYAVGVWSFEENGNGNSICGADICDSSSYGNHGTNTNTDWLSDTPSGQGYALNFDGSSNYIEVLDNSFLDFNPNNDSFTLEAWVKSIDDTNANQFIINKHDGRAIDPGYHIFIRRESNSGKLRFMIHTSVDSQSISGNTYLIDNKWHHIVAVYDVSVEKMYLYIDGKSDAIPVDYTKNNTAENSEFLFIGSYANKWFFNGFIDEVKIYRQALTSFKIQKNYVEGLEKHRLAEK